MLKSKIHRARVTGADIQYEGSITLDTDLMAAADIVPYEAVHVLDVETGARLQTYAIPGEAGSGTVCINGAAARLVHKGDTVIVLTYSDVPETEVARHAPRLVYVDADNRITHTKDARVAEPALRTRNTARHRGCPGRSPDARRD
jgi:aspartate 1-decarboxylase